MNAGPLDGPLVELVDGAVSGPGALAVGLVVAVAAGALHGLGPGHGKSVALGALVGEGARAVHALRLGIAVAGMHTFSALVLALGFVVLDLARVLEPLTSGLGVVAGVIVLVVGTWLLLGRLRARGHQRDHHHDHESVAHSGRGLLALGAAGGLVPSPTALLLLVSGLLTGRAVVATVLVVAFGLGLAATVAAVGLAAVRLGDRTRRGAMPSRLAALAGALPVLGAAGVCVAGVVLVGMSLA